MISFDIELSIRDAIEGFKKEQIYVLTDTNTRKHCLPLINKYMQLSDERVICIESGEKNKTLSTVEQIWDFLLAHGATRSSLLINLGGGTVTDLGGFAASTFMRGMQYVNIPTTLLAAVDASIGGKTGFNYKGFKNLIGVINMPKTTIIYPVFFRTLSTEQLLSGYAEMLKHALIASPLELADVEAFDWNTIDEEELGELIRRSIEIKQYIVEQDPEEHSLRKMLNLGHTIGHALEELSIKKGQPIEHGYAVMYGIVAELYLSVKRFNFPQALLTRMSKIMIDLYHRPNCSCSDYDELIELMRHDKKNSNTDSINFTLLQNIGNYRLNQELTEEEIKEALDYLFSL